MNVTVSPHTSASDKSTETVTATFLTTVLRLYLWSTAPVCGFVHLCGLSILILRLKRYKWIVCMASKKKWHFLFFFWKHTAQQLPAAYLRHCRTVLLNVKPLVYLIIWCFLLQVMTSYENCRQLHNQEFFCFWSASH